MSDPDYWGTIDSATVEAQLRPGEFKLSDGGRILFSMDAKQNQPTLIADVWRHDTMFNGVKCHCVNLEDLVVSNSAATVDEIPFLGVRLFVSVHKYRQLITDDFFIDYGSEENLRILAMADIKVGDFIGQEQTFEEDAEEGTDSTDAIANSPQRKWLEIYRWEGWWVPDKSGNHYSYDKLLEPAIQVAVWIVPRARRVIKICRLEDLNKDGRRSGIKYDFITEPGRFFSLSLAGWIRHSQVELDAVHNQRLDAGLISNVPFGFYKFTAGIKGQVLRIEPGTLKPLFDPAAIVFPQTNWRPMASFQEEAIIKRYGGEQSGLTDPAIGQFTAKRQSASEFVGTANALDLRTEMIVDRLVQSLIQENYRILGSHQQYAPRERVFIVSGEGGVETLKRFERDRLNGRLILHPTANLAQINEQLQRQLAIDMLGLLLNEILIQTGVVTPQTIYEAVALIAKLSHYDKVHLNAPQTPPQSDPPQAENHQMFAG